MPTPFGVIFYQAIAKAGFSANTFAKKMNTSSGYLSGIYSGNRTPPLERVELWADSLSLSDAEKRHFVLLAHLQHCTPFIVHLFHQLEQGQSNPAVVPLPSEWEASKQSAPSTP